MRYLLDTDVIIEMLRRNAAVRDQVKHLRHTGNVLCYSPVTQAELFAGMRPGEEIPTGHLLACMECLNIDGPVGEKAGLYLRTFRSSHRLQIGDALIAASAALADAALITFNARHYPMPDISFHSLLRSTPDP